VRRVVVTGLGLVTPVGSGVDIAWANILGGKSGAKKIEHFETDDLACQIAAIVPRVDGRGGGGPDMAGSFDPDTVLTPREQKRVDDFIIYSMGAADQAIADSGWAPAENDNAERERAGIMFGSGTGGLETTYDASITLHEKGPRRLSPFVLPGMLINLASGQISIKHGLKGPNHSVVTACATGAHAIGDAARLIQRGDADLMVAGGGEAAVCRLGIASFVACRAMTTAYNDTPEKASRPYDKDRDGFLMGEGAGAIVLEEYEHAKARGAKIYAELSGFGMSGDAHHMTSPSPGGEGAARCMVNAMRNAGLNPDQVQHLNAHGTSTPLGDSAETQATKKAFGASAENIAISSTKSMVGHLLGAAGGVEAVYTVMALHTQVAPPTINLHNPSDDCDLDYVPNVAREMHIENALTNSFGFGGTNGTLALKRFV